MILLSNVCKCYNKGKINENYVLNDINIGLPDSGFVAIYGESGCGKTTLLNIIGGLTSVTKGEVKIDDEEINDNLDYFRSNYIGVIFQNYHLDDKVSVFENVAAALKIAGINDESEIETRVKKALKSVDMDKYSKRHPNTLSGGQQQRVAIARAIVKKPSIILADEPTGNLDEENTKMVMDILKELSKKYLVVLVTHEENLLKTYCDRIIEISAGKIVSDIYVNECEEKNESKKTKVIKQKKYGCLFDLKNSIFSGIKSTLNCRNKFLPICLFLLACVFVFVTAFYATCIEKTIDAKNANNTNTFYMNVNDINCAKNLLDTIEESDIGIDYVQFSQTPILGDKIFSIDMPKLQSSLIYEWDDIVVANFHASLFSAELTKDLKVVCGEKENLDMNSVVITTTVADAIMKDSKITCINDYSTLLDFPVTDIIDERTYVIKGIVESEEYVMYLSEKNLAYYRYEEDYSAMVSTGDFFDINVNNGEVIVRVNSMYAEKIPSPGDTVMLNGKILKVSEVIDIYYSYEKWLSDTEIEKKSEEESEYSGFEYLDYYYAEYSEYIEYCKTNRRYVQYDECMKLVSEGCKEAWYTSVSDLCGRHDYYYAACFKMNNGRYPNEMELQEAIYNYASAMEIVEKLLKDKIYKYASDYTYLLSEDDYYECSKIVGKSKGYGLDKEGYSAYAVIHSKDVFATKKYLSENFGSAPNTLSVNNVYTTPDILYKAEKEKHEERYIESLLVWTLFVLIVSLCEYVLIHGNLINRIKQIGIYRSIGVTCKNIMFYFMIENATITLITAGLGWLVASTILWWVNQSAISYMIRDIIYYPVWIGAIVFVIISIISAITALILISDVLRKSPADIMSKHDI